MRYNSGSTKKRASECPPNFFFFSPCFWPQLSPCREIPPAPPNVCKARLWASSDRARFIFESDRPLNYRILGLQNPPRIALDLAIKDGDDVLARAVQSSITDAPYLADFRASRYNPDTLRFVFALNGDVRHETWRVAPVEKYGDRLVLDIHPVGGPDPLLALLLELEEKERAAPDGDEFIVVLDPGHGGEDPGAIGHSGQLEKDLVLQIAKRLRDEINTRPGMRALLTRDRDKFIPLAQRVEIAHQLGADAFLSIHADSVESPKPMGSSVYVLSTKGASSKLARRLAKTANLSDLIGGEAQRRHRPGGRALPAPNHPRRKGTGLAGAGNHAAAQCRPNQQSAWRRENSFGGVCGVKVPLHSLGAAGNRLHQQPAGGEKTAERRLSKKNGRRRGRRAAGIRRSVSCRRIRNAVTRGFQAKPALTTRPAPL